MSKSNKVNKIRILIIDMPTDKRLRSVSLMQFIIFKSFAYFQDEKSRWGEVYLFGYRIEQWGRKEVLGCVLYTENGGKSGLSKPKPNSEFGPVGWAKKPALLPRSMRQWCEGWNSLIVDIRHCKSEVELEIFAVNILATIGNLLLFWEYWQCVQELLCTALDPSKSICRV